MYSPRSNERSNIKSSYGKKLMDKKSYGIALFSYDTKEYKIVMVQKRNTYAFMDFILGHFGKNDDHRILELFNGMTVDEKMTILSGDFGLMWYRAWLINPESMISPIDKKITNDEFNKYTKCKKHFDRMFIQDGGKRLKSLINKSYNNGGKWEIPKGRRTHSENGEHEKDLTCAIREFYEETGISPECYNLLTDIEPRKIITADNKYRYVCYYYIAIANEGLRIDKVRLTDHQLITEIVDIKLMGLKELELMDPSKQYYNFSKGIIKFAKKNKLFRI